MPVFHIPIELFGIEVCAPQRAFPRTAQHDLVQQSATGAQFARAHRHTRRKVTTGHGTLPGPRDRRVQLREAGTGRLGQHGAPGIDIDTAQVDVGHHTFQWQRCHLVGGKAHGNCTAQHTRLGTRDVAHVGDRPEAPEVQDQLVLQTQAATDTRNQRLANQRGFNAHRQQGFR